MIIRLVASKQKSSSAINEFYKNNKYRKKRMSKKMKSEMKKNK